MRSILLKGILALALLVSPMAMANLQGLPADVHVQPLAAITNDRDASVSYLNLMLGAGREIRGILLETDPSGNPAADKARGQATTNVFPVEAIETGDGVVLGHGRGVKAILLRGRIDSQAGTGTLVIRYITNGLLMKYGECRVRLAESDNGTWRLVNAYTGDPVKRVKVKTWMLGISTLENVCPSSDTYASR